MDKKNNKYLIAIFIGLIFSFHYIIGTILGFGIIEKAKDLNSFFVIFKFLIFTAFVHFWLVYPLTNFVFKKEALNWRPVFRIILSFFLLSLPLISFSYYMCFDKKFFEFQELCVTVLPVVFIAAIFYEKAKSPFSMSLITAIGLFLPLFIINDSLSPYNVLFTFKVNNSFFYILRNFMPFVTILISLLVLNLKSNQSKDIPIFGCALLLLFSILISYGPALYGYFTNTTVNIVRNDLFIILYVILIYLFLKKSFLSNKLTLFIIIFMATFSIYKITETVITGDPNSMKLTLLNYHLINLIFFTFYLNTNFKKTVTKL